MDINNIEKIINFLETHANQKYPHGSPKKRVIYKLDDKIVVILQSIVITLTKDVLLLSQEIHKNTEKLNIKYFWNKETYELQSVADAYFPIINILKNRKGKITHRQFSKETKIKKRREGDNLTIEDIENAKRIAEKTYTKLKNLKLKLGKGELILL